MRFTPKAAYMTYPFEGTTSCYRILDLGPDAISFYNEIQNFISTITEYDHDHTYVANSVHACFIGYIVRLLNKPPAEAQDSILNFEGTKTLSYEFELLQLHEYDVFAKICMDHALRFYLYLRSQLEVKMEVGYSVKQVGLDFVTVREATLSYNQKAKGQFHFEINHI